MPSRNNPNVPSKLRRTASRSKVQKKRSNVAGKATSKKNARGTAASSVLYPTAGPAAPLSGKKARKVERALNHARQRAVEEAMKRDGEVVMTDAPKTTKPKSSGIEEERGDVMDVDGVS